MNTRNQARAVSAPPARLGGRLVPAALLFLSAVASGQIQGPERVDAHEPIVLSSQSDAKAYIWKVPQPAKRIAIDNGKTVHIWAPPGKYDVHLITINVDFKAETFEYKEHFATFQVGKPAPKPDPDVPDIPTPEPTAFKAKVQAAVAKVDPAFKALAPDVAGVYADVAGEAKASPGAWDPATMVAEAKTRISSALPVSGIAGWAGFWPLLAKAFKELKLEPTDLAGHIKAFEDVSQVLKGVK